MSDTKPRAYTGPSRAEQRKMHLLSPKWRDVADGKRPVESLDDEELFTGRLRNDDGVLGPRPAFYPANFVEEQQRRAVKDAELRIRTNLPAALGTIEEIFKDPNNATADRLKAATWYAERFLGKATERVVITADDPVEKLFRDLLADPDAFVDPGHPVVPGEVVSGD